MLWHGHPRRTRHSPLQRPLETDQLTDQRIVLRVRGIAVQRSEQAVKASIRLQRILVIHLHFHPAIPQATAAYLHEFPGHGLRVRTPHRTGPRRPGSAPGRPANRRAMSAFIMQPRTYNHVLVRRNRGDACPQYASRHDRRVANHQRFRDGEQLCQLRRLHEPRLQHPAHVVPVAHMRIARFWPAPDHPNRNGRSPAARVFER